MLQTESDYVMARRQHGAKNGHSLLSLIPDMAMADSTQVALFNAVGQTRRPFGQVEGWADLGDVLADRSQAMLTSQGDEAWRSAGGIRDKDGVMTFRCPSDAGAAVVRELAENEKGFLWTDDDEISWAVRLVPGAGYDRYHGFGITWLGAGWVFDQQAREQHRQVIEANLAQMQQADPAKNKAMLRKAARRLWLFERAERMLWCIHAAVLLKRQSVVLLPDVFLRELIWAQEPGGWPQNWRQEVMSVLRSLSFLHGAEFHIGNASWKPQFDSSSVFLTNVRDLKTKPSEDRCCESCLLWNVPGAPRHHHFMVSVGLGFLGVLERFQTSEDACGCRCYDFTKDGEGDNQKAIVAARKAGQLVLVHQPTNLAGSLPHEQKQILQGLVREITRQPRKNRNRVDKAEIQVGNTVSGTGKQPTITCPLLAPQGRYVAFGGNGRGTGRGYTLVGKTGTGWLYKCGYRIADNPDELCKTVTQFLGQLAILQASHGIIVAGLDTISMRWLGLEQLTSIGTIPLGLTRLENVLVRIYAPEDYLVRWREAAAGLKCQDGHQDLQNGLPGLPAAEGGPDNGMGGYGQLEGPRNNRGNGAANLLELSRNDQIATLLRQSHVSQEELANFLGYTQSFISQVLSGKRNWPDGKLEIAKAYLIDRVARKVG